MGKRIDPIDPQNTKRPDAFGADSKTEPEIDEIKQEIRTTRADMTETLEAIHGKLNPTVLKEQAVEQFREAKETVKEEVLEDFEKIKHRIRAEVKEQIEDAKSRLTEEYEGAKSAVREATVGRVSHMAKNVSEKVTQTGSSLVEVIKENPVPSLLAGAGLTWLFLNGRARSASRGSSYRGGSSYQLGSSYQRGASYQVPYPNYPGESTRSRTGLKGTAESALERGREVVGGAASAIAETASQFGDKVGETASRVGETASRVAGQTQDTVMEWAHEAGEQARRVEERIGRSMDENPFTVGMIALACGVAVGLAIPKTRKEDELMGQARDELVGKVEETAHAALGQVQRAAESSLDESQPRHS